MRIFTAFMLLLTISLVAATDEEIDAFMVSIVEKTIPHLPIIVDEQARTTSMFYDSNNNTLIYGVEVSIEGVFKRETLARSREKARAFTAAGACHNEEARQIMSMGVELHYRYLTERSKTDLFNYTITATDCGTEI